MSDEDLRKRIEAGAKWMPGFNEKPIPPRLTTLVKFIRKTRPDLRVTLRNWTTSTDRKVQGSRLRWPGKGRKGKLLEIRDPKREHLNGGIVRDADLLLRHESGDCYRHNGDVCQWIVKRLAETEKGKKRG